MNTPDGAGARIIRRIEELLQQSTLAPDKVLDILRRADAEADIDPLSEMERLECGQQEKK